MFDRWMARGGQGVVVRGEMAVRRDAAALPALAALAVACLVWLAGCSMFGGGAPKPTTVDGSVVAAKDLNPSISQRPSPMTLRIYELKSDTAFNRADFMSLYQSDQTALAADLLAREEFVLQPGETRAWRKTLKSETRYLAVFGAYRDLERARWSSVVAVQPGRAQALTIRADALGVSAQVQAK